jgi:arylsulfatase A
VTRTLLAFAAALAWLAADGAVVRQPASNRPNILLVQADDLGYGDLSAYGQAHFATPHLERLAREGIRFTNYYAGSTQGTAGSAATATSRCATRT